MSGQSAESQRISHLEKQVRWLWERVKKLEADQIQRDINETARGNVRIDNGQVP